MSREAVVSMFKSIDQRDWQALAGSLAEDVIYERPGYEPLVGKERVLKFYRQERVISSGIHELLHIMVNGQEAICDGRFTGVVKDGRAVDVRFAEVYSFSQDLVKRRTTYFFAPCI